MESIAVIGLGKLGLTWALVLASKGYDVHGIDVNVSSINSLKEGKLTISEDGCDQLFSSNRDRLSFYSRFENIEAKISTVFIIVPTPSLGNHCFDSSYVRKALSDLDPFLCKQKSDFINIVITSTVMPGECESILTSFSPALKDLIENGKVGFCYNPEFIALGSVVKDMLNPDFILIGANNSESASKLSKVYKVINGQDVVIKSMSLTSAEVSKIGINTFLTLKISYANTVGMLCSQLQDTDKYMVCDAIGTDTRIGAKYLKPGLGFGGPCLPRDTRAFGQCLEMFGLPGLKNLNQYYKIFKEKKFQNLTLVSKENSSKIPYCPIIAGINFLDQVNNLEELEEIKFDNLGFPILFIPFVSRASEIIGKRIFLTIDEKEFLLNFNQSIYSNYLNSDVLEKSDQIKIKFIENKNMFSETEWQELYKLSEDTFVEETDKLKQNAAGAGLTDND